ncbi:MAG: hypothetical protein LIQ31_13390 [Planctomycetes bacterium]|nr:hypothetical protein [Planctomycetota bacterium]
MSTNDHSQLINRNEPNQHMAKSIVYAGQPLNTQLDGMKANIAERPTAAQVADGYYGKREVDAQLAEKAGTDHSQLLNRDQPNQHMAKAISYNGAPLNAQLNTIKADIAQRPTADQVAEGYYGKSEIDAQLAGKAGTDHGQLENRDAADQHPAAAITYNGAALDMELDLVRADVATKVTASDVAANHYTKAEADAQLAGKPNTYDATCVTTGTRHDLTIPAFPAPSPATFTVRVTMDANYRFGNTFHLGGIDYAARTQTNDPAPDDVVKADATIEIVFDASRGLAFFRTGVGARNGWNISVGGETPVTEGIHVPDAVRPSRIYLDNLFNLYSPHIKQVASGSGHTIVLLHSGRVLSCGRNDFGQLGRIVASGTDINSNLGFIPDMDDVISISAGGFQSFFIRSNGSVWSCGRNTRGVLGWNAPSGDESKANLGCVPGLADVKMVAASGGFTLFLLHNGKVLSCGVNQKGQLGRAVPSPTESTCNLDFIPTLEDIEVVATGSFHSLFLHKTNQVSSCGGNDRTQLGRHNHPRFDGSETVVNLDKISMPKVKAISASAGGNHSLFICTDGTVWSCGHNNTGQLGRVATAAGNTCNLGQITEFDDVVSISAGDNSSLFLKSDGTVWSSGWNHMGQLGRAVNDGLWQAPNLGQIPGLNDVSFIHTTYESSFFIEGHGTLFTCGANNYGQLARMIATGNQTTINLGEINKATSGIGEPLPLPYGDGALLFRHKGVDEESRVCVFNDGFSHLYASPIGVFQVESNKAVEKGFQIRR